MLFASTVVMNSYWCSSSIILLFNHRSRLPAIRWPDIVTFVKCYLAALWTLVYLLNKYICPFVTTNLRFTYIWVRTVILTHAVFGITPKWKQQDRHYLWIYGRNRDEPGVTVLVGLAVCVATRCGWYAAASSGHKQSQYDQYDQPVVKSVFFEYLH